ncbi:MAG TPA: MYXO-CTERM sorting domain-containing protein, partial [Polyangiales bacterium]
CDGPQVLQIPMPKVRPFGRSGGGGLATTENLAFYYLELRTQRGFDDTIRSAPTVLVRVAEEFRSRTDRGRHTWILDMDPASRNTIEGLTLGKSYTDPAGGVTFKVAALTADGAQIEITGLTGTGGSTCLDNTPFDPAQAPPRCAGVVGTPGSAPDGGVPDAGPTTPPPRAELLILVNADTEMDIMPVEDGKVLDLSTLPPNLTMRVDTDPPMVGSVAIRIDGTLVRTDNTQPYSISNEDRGMFMPWNLALGAHTVNATPFDGADGGSRAGEPIEIDFTLVRGGAAGGDGGLDGGGAAIPDGGTQQLGDGGLGTTVNPITGGDGGLALGDAALVPPLKKKDDDGCSCHVPGSDTGTPGLGRAWAMAAFAIGLLVRRRVQRSRRK